MINNNIKKITNINELVIGLIIELNNRPCEITRILFSHSNKKILIECIDIFTFEPITEIINIINLYEDIKIIIPNTNKFEVLGINCSIITLLSCNDDKIFELNLTNKYDCKKINELMNDFKNIQIELLIYNHEYKITNIEEM